MTLSLILQDATSITSHPNKAQFRRWTQAVLEESVNFPFADHALVEMTIRLVDEAESAELNIVYRHKSGPTNVLSFPFDNQPDLNLPPYLGDLVICAPIVVKEAIGQGKPILAHWTHLTVHGLLHLLNYDHETEAQANAMEGLEVAILAKLGISNPYLGQ